MTQEELEFRRRCPYDAFGDYSDVLKEIRQKEKLCSRFFHTEGSRLELRFR